MHTFAQKQKPRLSALRTHSRPWSSHSQSVQSILHLQRTVGNQSVQRLLKSNPAGLNAASTVTESTRFAHDFSRIPIFSPSPPVQVQPKLKVNTPGDIYEQEADRVAEHVMQMPDSTVQRQPKKEIPIQTKPIVSTITPLVQHQTEPEQEEEVLESVSTRDAGELGEEEEEKLVQPKTNTGAAPQITPGIAHDVHSFKGTGRPLPASERAFFEPRFGRDFSNVRLHTDNRAARTAQTINARAFTLGCDVVFGAGQYSPGAISHRKLVAHELTHVVQQQGRGHVSQNRALNNLSMSVQSAPAQLVQLDPLGRRKQKKKQKTLIKKLYQNFHYFIKNRYRYLTTQYGRLVKQLTHNWLRKVRVYINVWLLPERSTSLNKKIIKILRSAIRVLFETTHLLTIPEKLEKIYINLLKIKYKPTPDEYAKAWKYRRQYKSKTQSIRNLVPKKYKKLLSLMMYKMMPPYPGSDLCGYAAWQYLRRLMSIQTVGVPKVIGKHSYSKLQKQYPGTSKWQEVFKRDKVGNNRSISKKGDFDKFKMVGGGKWIARLRSDDPKGYTDKPLKMFDLIRIGKGFDRSGRPTDLHYVVWLGGDSSWVIESVFRRVLKIKNYQRKMGGFIVVQKIIRSETIAKAIP